MKKWFLPVLLLAALVSGCADSAKPSELDNTPSAETPAVVESVSPAPEQPSPAPEATETPPTTPEPEPYDYEAPVPEREAMEDDWFADAVFIGDSRTDGLRLYSGIEGVDFLCYKGLTVFEVMEDKPVIQQGESKVGVLQALEQKEYAKVYISLGVNELGYNYNEGFRNTYADMVDRICELEPQADIYLQLLIPVNAQKCEETKQFYYVNNEQIGVYNEIIRTLAAEKQIYLLDVGEAFVDENGELPYDASSDGIHFKRDGYKLWYDYLKTHTVEHAEEETK